MKATTYTITRETCPSSGKLAAVLVKIEREDGTGGTLRIPANGKPQAAVRDASRWISADITATLGGVK